MARIAIVGSGISGMGSAYALHQAGHEITLYEKNAVTGGHTRTLTVDYDGVTIPVDTGFIVYNEPNYPNLVPLFKHLGVETQESNMSFAISMNQGKFEWGARSLNAVFGQRSNCFKPSFYKLVGDVMKFNGQALALVETEPNLSLGELVTKLKLGSWFRDYYLLPMGGAIWSCPASQMLEFPAITFVQFFKNHGLLGFSGQHQWYTVTGGSQNYMSKITAPYRDRIRTHCAVTNVTRHANHVTVTDSTGSVENYDRIIFACHANETLAMLADASPEEKEILGTFHYSKNTAYLHRDMKQMPKRKACWASWVYHADTGAGSEDKATKVGVTYWMNLLQSIDTKYPLFVTLNPTYPIDPKLVFNVHEFDHPIFNGETLLAQARVPSLQGKRNSWFCGAYTRYGFHEDGLLSAVRVVQSMGEKIPWH